MLPDRLQIKVCGLKDPVNIEAVGALSPDFVGFNFWPRSKRYVGEDFSAAYHTSLPAEIRRIGVFVNEELDTLSALTEHCLLDGIQLHGDEDLAFCREVRQLNQEKLIIKAFRIEDSLPIEQIKQFSPLVDYFLFDRASIGYGGSGKRFDWNLLKEYRNETPVLIAGGVDENGLDFLKDLHRIRQSIAGVDVNSKVELEPGMKSTVRIKKVMEHL